VRAPVERLRATLMAADIRVHVDRRDGQSPGFKFNDWEMRGVPVRMEIGPKDVENGNAVLARRDVPGRAGKQFVSQASITDVVRDLLADIQRSLLDDARAFRDSHIVDVADYAQLCDAVAAGEWARAAWAGSDIDEQRVKDETGATIRCFPFDQPERVGKCIATGESADKVALFAKAY
ncbi:MAG: His/Gly/Thr/Pro-type tRNA ligase C-terminal domain-containing protein, partial [Chloroflexi bacterium]|nr:His/Gly/Thr/Pro-type tRNA ligase C-terminal domain-containing protein [Chloroflexota bacterium]